VFFDNLQVFHNRGPVLEETHYYPFGLVQAGISSKALSFGGAENKYKFNGIEQNNDFDLNMYDAFYRNLDPQIGRFWQIDPKLELSINISPYAAMDNNPILKSDPLGDIAIIDDAVIGFFKGLFRKRSNFEGGAKTRFGNAFRSAGRHAANSAKIYGGLFTSDNNRSFFGQVGEILSRFTWQLPNTIAGFAGAHIANMGWNVNSVDYEAGATVLNVGNNDWGGLTLGSFILGDHTIKADPDNSLFQHEYGHYLQSQALGPRYFIDIALPSFFDASITHRNDYFGHMNFHTEKDASTRSLIHFNNLDKWDFYLNPIDRDPVRDAIRRAVEKRKAENPHPGDAGPADKHINPLDKQ
jgi:RHS repeat-associated protein